MSYKITVKRLEKDGTLTFTSLVKTITAKCYWNLSKKIPAGTYSFCSATTMKNKKNSKGKPREGIFIPNVSGYTQIFIHMGKQPYQLWSDGCIVIEENKLLEIYNEITPKNAKNVTVVIEG